MHKELENRLRAFAGTRQRRNLFGYWCLACDQANQHLDDSDHYNEIWDVKRKLLKHISYKQLHKMVTRRLQALSRELQQLATISQGKPLLGKCLNILSGKFFKRQPKLTPQGFAITRCQIVFAEAIMHSLYPDDEVFTEFWTFHLPRGDSDSEDSDDWLTGDLTQKAIINDHGWRVVTYRAFHGIW